MAIIYSLICFGGRTGKTVTFTVSGSVVNLANHGLRDGKGVAFTSTGTLPTGLTAGTIYYVRSTGLNTFTLHSTQANALSNTGKVTFTTTGSGTHNVKGEYFLSLTSAQLARYGEAGSERIYDGLVSWRAARSSLTTPFDPEVAEIGDSFVERYAGQIFSVQLPNAPTTTITSIVNGTVSQARHTGPFDTATLGNGYAMTCYQFEMGNFTLVEGICVAAAVPTQSSGVVRFTSSSSSKFRKNYVYGGNTGYCTGVLLSADNQSVVDRNVIIACRDGITNFGAPHSTISNNIVVKCATGFVNSGNSMTNRFGYWYNNISVGNTVNWGTKPNSLEGAASNFGGPSDTPWVTGMNTAGVISESDFVDFANNDFRPATTTSPQVDAGVTYYNASTSDMDQSEVPAYAGGGAELIDAGAFEKDLGFGPRPAAHTLTLRNVAIGSRILIESQDGGTVHYNALASSSEVVATITVYGDARDQWEIKVRKASESPFYIPWSTLTTVTAGESSIYVSQIPDE